jgi:hypothetical protein
MYSPQAQRTPEGEDYFLSVFFVKTAGVTSILELHDSYPANYTP